MAVRIVLDCPHPYLGHRLRELFVAAIGVVSAVIGTVAWLLIIPLSFAVIAWLRGEDITIQARGGPVITTQMWLAAWGVTAACLVLGLRGRGLRLVRGARTSVLFLRRFGYTDATRAVTFAVRKTIGRTWRLVTLDDKQTAALGIPPAPKWFFTISYGVMRVVLAPFRIFRYYPVALWVAIGIIAIDVTRAIQWPARGTTVETVVTRYTDLLETLFSRRLPLDAVRLDLPGMFAAILIVMGWPIVVVPPIFVLVPPWVWLIALAFFVYVALSIDAVRGADKARTGDVKHEAGIDTALNQVGEASQKLLAPRMFVLRVDSSVWHETVSRFARRTSVALVDISEPSANLLWEIEELTLRTKTPCVFIGEYDRVAPLGDDSARSQSELAFPQLALLLGEQEVLAYTADRPGWRRFARALRGKLREVTSRRS